MDIRGGFEPWVRSRGWWFWFSGSGVSFAAAIACRSEVGSANRRYSVLLTPPSLSATGKWVGCAEEIGIRNYGMELGYVRYTLVTIIPVMG